MSTGTEEILKYSVSLDRTTFQIIEREAAKEGITIGELSRRLLAREYGVEPDVQVKKKSVPFSDAELRMMRRHHDTMRISKLAEEVSKISGVERNPGTVINQLIRMGLRTRDKRKSMSL
jgi:hypothetical protein